MLLVSFGATVLEYFPLQMFEINLFIEIIQTGDFRLDGGLISQNKVRSK